MNLTKLLTDHQGSFRKKLIEALARKNSIAAEQAEVDFKDFIQQYIDDKYAPAVQLIDMIKGIEKPVLLNIRRGREGEERCPICEANQPNVDEVSGKYGDKIKVIEASVDKPDGGALYHIIFHKEAQEKKVPLTAVINKGEVLMFRTGMAVEPLQYEEFFKPLLE